MSASSNFTNFASGFGFAIIIIKPSLKLETMRQFCVTYGFLHKFKYILREKKCQIIEMKL